jgi:ribose-phosphate pyrophosphokinase
MNKLISHPDGTTYWKIEEDEPQVVYRIGDYAELWQLGQYVDAHNHKYAERPAIIIPWLIDGQADKRFNDDESSGLKQVCKFLNGMDADFVIFHPHNPEVVEAYMGDKVEIMDNTLFVNKVLKSIGDHIDESVSILSPDAGAYKWINKTMDTLGWKGDVLSASKVRTYVNGKTKLKQQLPIDDFGGKDVLIIDDISIGGGTFKGLSALLDSANVGKKYLAVSHITVQGLGEDPVTDYFDKVFTTNSVFEKYFSITVEKGWGKNAVQPKNLEIIELF